MVGCSGVGASGGLTRPNGFLLGAALGTLAVTPLLPPWLTGGTLERAREPQGQADRAAVMPGLLVASAAGIGVLVYSAYIWSLTGDPLTWAKPHAAWGRRYTGLWYVIGARYAFIGEQGWHLYMSNLHHDLLNALGVVFVLAAAWPVARRFGLAYAVFILINILPPLASGGLLSAGRFSAVLFPAFLWFARRCPPTAGRLDRVLHGGSGVERHLVLHLAAALLNREPSSGRPGSLRNRQI